MSMALGLPRGCPILPFLISCFDTAYGRDFRAGAKISNQRVDSALPPPAPISAELPFSTF